jgi:exopolyphosphatase/guanosine-5'-triphosphate,3'-diphosphate pyrophosphatase
VATLALKLFDATRAIHALTDREREWLEYACLLHDVGVHIRYERHHKHSYYLIRNGNLRGFEPTEVEVIALIARYHRRATPLRGHEGYGDLGGRRRRVVRTLAAMLRLAETLDRSHCQMITGLTLQDREEELALLLQTDGDAELELWAASRHVGPLEDVLGKPVRLEAQSHAPAAPVRETSRALRKSARERAARRIVDDVGLSEAERQKQTGPKQPIALVRARTERRAASARR